MNNTSIISILNSLKILIWKTHSIIHQLFYCQVHDWNISLLGHIHAAHFYCTYCYYLWEVILYYNNSKLVLIFRVNYQTLFQFPNDHLFLLYEVSNWKIKNKLSIIWNFISHEPGHSFIYYSPNCILYMKESLAYRSLASHQFVLSNIVQYPVVFLYHHSLQNLWIHL